ncbi:MAG TPA: hypothetical protein VGF69_26485 [Thermoanaerobaculia bacterium]|jgi:tetratricopeptide (TPR) repeat protein
MTVERHYDDEALISFLESGQTAARRDHHLATCRTCSETLASFEAITEVLGLEAAWDLRELRTEPVPSTIATLRAFADRMATEDAAAALFVKDLLAGSRESWMPRLQQHPEFRTAGVVRKLIEATDHALDTMPPDAVEITNLAVEIAEGLDPAAYASDTVMKLRGAAWRERAYASFYVGNAKHALEAICVAESHLSDCVVDKYDRARLELVRALIYRPLERVSEALDLVSASSRTFDEFGDRAQVQTSTESAAYLLTSTGDYRSAIGKFSSLLPHAESTGDLAMQARLHVNIGGCLREIGEVPQAMEHFQIAAELYAEAGVPTEALRHRWNVARLLQSSGHTVVAAQRFSDLRKQFLTIGMAGTAVLVGLDLAEILIVEGKHAEVKDICHEAITELSRSGLAYSERAMTALAYLREAAEQSQISVPLVNHVREYIRKLPDEPRRLFAPMYAQMP